MNLYKSEDRFDAETNFLTAENITRNAKKANTMIIPSEKEVGSATVIKDMQGNPLLGIPGHIMAIPSNPNLQSIK